jgi:protein-L-isoaspartate O-methyltransferase
MCTYWRGGGERRPRLPSRRRPGRSGPGGRRRRAPLGLRPPELVDQADDDWPLLIPHGQVTTQPSLVARMIEALEPSGTERVLEVGTGNGWQTALLARLAEEVWSVKRLPDVAETARQNLRRRGAEPAHVVVGDGTEGLAERSPFDAVLVAAAFPTVPPPLITQLPDGGRLVCRWCRAGRTPWSSSRRPAIGCSAPGLSSWRTSSGSSGDTASTTAERCLARSLRRKSRRPTTLLVSRAPPRRGSPPHSPFDFIWHAARFHEPGEIATSEHANRINSTCQCTMRLFSR